MVSRTRNSKIAMLVEAHPVKAPLVLARLSCSQPIDEHGILDHARNLAAHVTEEGRNGQDPDQIA